jgi:hypothetical protein
LTACSATAWTARSRISRSRRAMPRRLDRGYDSGPKSWIARYKRP